MSRNWKQGEQKIKPVVMMERHLIRNTTRKQEQLGKSGFERRGKYREWRRNAKQQFRGPNKRRIPEISRFNNQKINTC